MSLIDDVMQNYRERLAARDSALQAVYVRRWMWVENALEAQYLSLAMDALEMRDAGMPVTHTQVLGLERYQSLLTQTRDEVRRFSAHAAGLIGDEQELAVNDGLGMGVDAIYAQMRRVGVQARFNRLPVEAVRAMIGLAGDGTPLAQLLEASYPESVGLLTQALINGVALGYNPKKTARMMATAMSGNLQRALLVSRSEQMRAFRAAQVQQWQASGVVGGYRRRCALSQRTCLACMMEDGRVYQTYNQYSDHPGGRCTAEPILEHYDIGPTMTGRQYFEKLDAEKQREIMGDGLYQAWQEGTVGLDQVSRMHNHPVWGESPRVVTLEELTNV